MLKAHVVENKNNIVDKWFFCSQIIEFMDLGGYLNPDYALELRYEKLKCNKSDIYIRKA